MAYAKEGRQAERPPRSRNRLNPRSPIKGSSLPELTELIFGTFWSVVGMVVVFLYELNMLGPTGSLRLTTGAGRGLALSPPTGGAPLLWSGASGAHDGPSTQTSERTLDEAVETRSEAAARFVARRLRDSGCAHERAGGLWPCQSSYNSVHGEETPDRQENRLSCR